MFTNNDTKAIKGAAVIMMLFHHLACFSDRFPVGFKGFESVWDGFITDGYLSALATNVRICVAVFFFLGGYGLYKRYEAGKFSLMDSILSLFKKYWKVFIVFIPIAYIFFARTGSDINFLATKYNFENGKELISKLLANFAALDNSLNGEWWFIQSYICALIAGTVFCTATKKNKSFAVDLFLVFIVDILIRNVFPAIANSETFSVLNFDFYYVRFFKMTSTASAFFAGIVFAKHDGIVRIKNVLSEIPGKPIIGLLGCLAVLWSRSFIMGDSLDLVYSFMFVAFLSVFLDGIKPLKTGLGFIGVHSTNIWLIHSFYCYNFLEVTKIVYSTSSVWIDLLILLAMSLVSSIILEFVFKKLGYIISLIKSKTSAAQPAAAMAVSSGAVMAVPVTESEEDSADEPETSPEDTADMAAITAAYESFTSSEDEPDEAFIYESITEPLSEQPEAVPAQPLPKEENNEISI
ncbi:MAG: acyltransferase [Ruminococcus sp.]|nr:acyltransferase [Ruminococcus sp.]